MTADVGEKGADTGGVIDVKDDEDAGLAAAPSFVKIVKPPADPDIDDEDTMVGKLGRAVSSGMNLFSISLKRLGSWLPGTSGAAEEEPSQRWGLLNLFGLSQWFSS